MKKALVINLDGTLIHSDMLYETFWSSFSKDWKVLFKSVIWYSTGKSNLKYKLSLSTDVNVSNLPYNKAVIDYIKTHRKKYRHIVLITASNQNIANKIAKYLNLFDEVKGSTKESNLIGGIKAKSLKNRYGVKNYDYIGDSMVDLPIWKNADKAITVNANNRVVKACKKINKNSSQIKSRSSQNIFQKYLRTMRIHHWIKNLLVFVPMLAAHQITYENFYNSFLAFIVFCLIASSVYIVNDLLDLDADRSHPYNRFRPLASGELTIKNGMIISIILFLTGALVSCLVGFNFILLIVFYWILTIVYSLILKRKVLIDIFILGVLYTLRISGGSFATEIQISFWLFIFSIFLFLSLASVKRQSELVDLANNKKFKTIGRGYNADDLPLISMIALSTGVSSVLVATLYINSSEALILYSKIWTLGIACYILFLWIVRIIFESKRGMLHGDPIVYSLKDRTSIFCFLAIISLFIINFI